MDEYGSFDFSKEDIELVCQKLLIGPVVVPISSIETMSSYVIMLSNRFSKIGILPFGGKPGGVLVGVLFKGFFWFDPKKDLYAIYVGEKLGVGERDAEFVTKFLNCIFKSAYPIDVDESNC